MPHGPGAAKSSVLLEALGGLYSAVSVSSAPEGASVRCYDNDYDIGDTFTRNHLVNYYSFGNIAIGPNAPSVAIDTQLGSLPAWSNPGGVLLNDATPAIVSGVPHGSSALDITGFAFNSPSTASTTGITATILGYSTASAFLTVQLLLNGAVIGTAKVVPIGPSTTSVTLGGATDNWGATLTEAVINAASFGLRIIATSAFPLASALLNLVTLTAAQTSANANFNFITSFTSDDGTIRNLSMDALGNLWIENATTNPGVLDLLDEGLTPGSYGVAQEIENADYFAISDLTQGSDVPRQYNSQGWLDRITQVGPGAAPIFAASTNTGTTPAAITAWAASGGIVTFTSTNSFTAGEIITLSGFGTTTAFNGLVLDVLGSGLSGSQFEVQVATVTGGATEAGLATPQYTYPIVASPNGITQLAARTRTFAGMLWSSAPGVLTAGTTITFYYSDSTTDVADAQLVNLFNSGVPVYVFISGSPIGNGTWQVTSVGIGTQPTEARQDYYFTIQVPQTEAANYRGQDGYGFTYQITAATVTTVVPVPNLTAGQQFSIAGASPSNWDNLWTVSQALNSSTMAITQTSMVAGIATYSYALTGGSTAPPAVGELVTVTNTLNGSGIFNVIDVPITAVTGTNTGTFNVGGFPTSDNFSTAIEDGQAQTAGTQFTFDPGAVDAGTQSSPIFGNGGGGVLSLVGSGSGQQVISPGTKQGVVFFITRNGYETTPSPPVQFEVPINTNYILATLIPVGPPNVIARGIAFTESGQNGVPGANFFTIPTLVQNIINGVKFTSNALIINDNVTTSAKFTFSDNVLLSATAIDVQGNNLFNLIEIGNPGWLKKYAFRMMYGECQNKLQNFLNLSFDGGYIPGTNPLPLGWSSDPTLGVGGVLLNSPIFGNSYYVKNSSNAAQPALGMITQPAFQDAYQQPIISINTTYSVRVTARIPAGLTAGTLVVDLVDSNLGTGYGTTYGTFSLPLADLTDNFAIFTGTLLTAKFTSAVPPGLLLRYWIENAGVNVDVEVDRIEPYPTAVPVLNTQVFMSYANEYESVDAVTGVLNTNGQNQQVLTGAQVMDGNLYLLKTDSWYETQDTPNTEPAYWDDARDVSQKAGACGPLASDQGEGWVVTACRNGVYLYTGGQPQKCSMDVFQIWDAINWEAGETIWVKNDVNARKLYIGVPLPTPNFWLPNASSMSAPTSPNVVLMMNYWGVESGEELKQSGQVHATMFGNLMAPDMKRKWSIWQIKSPFADFVKTSPLDRKLMICNGIASSKIYTLEPTVEGVIPTDDGAPINSLYTTYSWNSSSKVRANPLMGNGRIRWEYGTFLCSGAGSLNVKLYGNALLGPDDTVPNGYQQYTVPGGFPLTDPCVQDREFTANFSAYRMWMEFSTAGYFDLSSVTMTGRKDIWNQVTGRK